MTCHSLRSVRTWSLALTVSLLAVVLVHSSSAVAATTDNWNTSFGNWSTAANWTNSSSGHTVPAQSDTVDIINSDTTSRTITYDYTGSAVVLTSLYIGNQGTGTNSLSMTGNTLKASSETIGYSGNGAINQSGGTNGLDIFGILILGYGSGGNGTYNLSAGTVGRSDAFIQLGGTAQATGTFNQTGGSTLAEEVDIGQVTGATGTYNLSGFSTLTATDLEVGLSGGGNFNQTGGTNTVSTLSIGDTGGSGGYTLSGGALNASTSITVGNGGTGVLNVSGSGALTTAGNLTVNTGSKAYLSGGTISANNLAVTGTFQWMAGTLNINGSQTTTIGTGGPFGSVFTLGSGQNLNLFNSLTVNAGSLFTMNGGNLTEYSMINNGNVVLNSGGFTTYTLFNQTTGLFVVGQSALINIQGPASNSGEIELGGEGATIYNGQGYTITNTGLIHGDGLITMNINNQSGGEIRAEDGKILKFNGGGTNFGKINLQGGTLELTSPMTNGAGSGQIEGRGTLIVGGTGLTNNGNMAFSAGISDVFGDVHNSTGSASQGITISGNANVTFWDDVTNGTSSSDPTLFKVSSGSTATFFGTYSGNGVSGPGSVFYEADVSPGFSPASVNYGGNVTLDSTARLNIQLGGTTVGSQYDKLNVAGQLALGGGLDVSLINNYRPKAGDTFDVLDWHSLSGTFADVNLPTLGGRIVWNSSQLYTTGVLSVIASYYAGDFNRDGHVDAADISIAEQALTNISGYQTAHSLTDPTLFNLVADVNGDGKFTIADLQDLLLILKNGGGSADPVPEPSTFAMLVGSLLFTLPSLRRTKRWSQIDHSLLDDV
jgi:hypothetical protein